MAKQPAKDYTSTDVCFDQKKYSFRKTSGKGHGKKPGDVSEWGHAGLAFFLNLSEFFSYKFSL